MAFLRFKCQGHEWGFAAPSSIIPSIGDLVLLGYAIPDHDDTFFVEADVISRHLGCPDEFSDKDFEIHLSVKLREPIPDGFVANSPAWPSIEWTKRKQATEDMLARIGKPKE